MHGSKIPGVLRPWCHYYYRGISSSPRVTGSSRDVFLNPLVMAMRKLIFSDRPFPSSLGHPQDEPAEDPKGGTYRAKIPQGDTVNGSQGARPEPRHSLFPVPLVISSPLEALRPPSPPSAADAQPFIVGQLNRTNRTRNYVNINVGSGEPRGVTRAEGGGNQVPAGSAPPLASERMDLHRLLRNHHNHPKAAETTPGVTPETPPPPQQPPTPTFVNRHVHHERCVLGWSPRAFFRVVADVEQYSAFLPWCLSAKVHSTRPIPPAAGTDQSNLPHEEDGGAVELRASLCVGFSIFREQYRSRVTLLPCSRISVVLADENLPDSKDRGDASWEQRPAGMLVSLLYRAANSAGMMGGSGKSILSYLSCEWEFLPVPVHPNEVEVRFALAFEFRNPFYSRLISSNIVDVMTSSFEKRCEQMYGPPSVPRRVLPRS